MSIEDGKVTDDQIESLARIAKQLAPSEEHRNGWDEGIRGGAAGAGAATVFAYLALGSNPVGWGIAILGSIVAGVLSYVGVDAVVDFDTDMFVNGGKSKFINRRFYELISAFIASSEDMEGRDYITAMNIINAAETYINNDRLLFTEDDQAFIPFRPVEHVEDIVEYLEKYKIGDENFSYYLVALGLELSRKNKDIAFVQMDGDFDWENVEETDDVNGFITGTVGITLTDKDQRGIIIDKTLEVIESGNLTKISNSSLISTIVQNGYGWSDFNTQLSEHVTSEWSKLQERTISLEMDTVAPYFLPKEESGFVKIDDTNKEENINPNGRLITIEEQQQGVMSSFGPPADDSTELGKIFKRTINFPSDMANDDEERETLANFEGFIDKKIYSYEFKALNKYKTLEDTPWYAIVTGRLGTILWLWFQETWTPAEYMELQTKTAYMLALTEVLDSDRSGVLDDTIGEHFQRQIKSEELLKELVEPIIIDKELVRRIKYFKELIVLTEDGDLTDEEKDEAEKKALDAFLEGDFGEDAETLDKSTIENRRKYFKQCALMLNMPDLHAVYQDKLKEIYYKDIPYHGRFVTLRCESTEQETMLSSLVSSAKEQSLFELPTHKVTKLMPKIRLFKVFSSNGKEKEVEFIFNRQATTDRERAGESPQTKFMEANFDKGTGVGLKEFSFEFNGTNPAEARNDVKASLKLYFQSFGDFIRFRKGTDDEMYRYVDLVIQPTPDKENKVMGVDIKSDRQYEPQFYRIRAEVGYFAPTEKDGFTKEEIEAIKTSNKSFFLNMVDHDISFGKDGTVQITISYRAYLESLLKHPRLDALASPRLIQRREDNSRRLAEQLNKKECTVEQIKELQISLAAQEEVIVKQSLSSIINRLRARDAIYNVKVKERDKDYFHRKGFFRKCEFETEGVTSATDDSSDIRLVLNSDLPEASDDFNFLDTDDRNIQFFFFGDLLYTILDCVYAGRGTIRENTGFSRSSIILGSFEFEPFQQSQYTNTIYNIADLPISVDFFSRWFVDNVVSQKTTRKTFPVMTFIRNLSNQLIKQSLLENCVNRNIENRLRFQTAQVSAFSKNGVNPLLNSYSLEGDRGRPNITMGVSSLRKSGVLPLKGGPETDADTSFKDFHTFIVLNALGSTLSYSGVGDYEEDIKNGRFHVHIGQNSGLVKNLSISKSDLQYIREARFFQNGIDGLLQLSAVYKANLEMFGNTLFYPGMEFFFNPFGLGGTELGSPTDRSSVANKLGFGGYHTITSVKSTISPGKFTTSIVGQQYYSGDGSGNPNLIKKDGKMRKPNLLGEYEPENSSNPNAYQNCKNIILDVQGYDFEEGSETESSPTDIGGTVFDVETAAADEIETLYEGDEGVVTVYLEEPEPPSDVTDTEEE